MLSENNQQSDSTTSTAVHTAPSSIDARLDATSAPQSIASKRVTDLSVERYTEKTYIEAVKEVFGGRIDLDPASCALANTVVQADRYFSKEDNGLVQPWRGNVFLNPPWGNAAKPFVRKVLAEYQAGNVPQAILVLNGASVLEHYQDLLADFQACHARVRPKYWTVDRDGNAIRVDDKSCRSPMHLTAFVYLGPNRERFRSVFRKFGRIKIDDTGDDSEQLAA